MKRNAIGGSPRPTRISSREARMTDPRADSTPPAAPLPERTRVLVADDDEPARRLLARALEAHGFAVDTAGNGIELVRLVESDPPAIILLDFDMPLMNGAEACAWLRGHARDELRNIPIIMLTAYDGETEEVACLGAGANDFISKPITRASLAARIETQIRLRALNDTLRAQNDELARWRSAQVADLEAAQRVQQAILPGGRILPGWLLDVRYTPLIQVGGDVFGVAPSADGGLVWLADATGHGVAAALCTTLVAILFDRAAFEADPRRVLSRVNAGLHEIFRGSSMMSAACIRLLADGEIRFAGAGHPPLLVRRSGGSVESCASQSTLLGLDADLGGGIDSVRLEPGDRALLFTDGLYGARRADGTRRILEEVAPAFSRAGTIPGLIAALGAEGASDDDLTVIVVERTRDTAD